MRRLSAISPIAQLAALLALSISAAFAQTQGVSKNEIVIGTEQDLSGPIVAFSKQLKNGMEMRVEEINAAGGIHGRKLKLIIEDHGYDPKKAVLATQKLVQKDKIFAMVGSIGTATGHGRDADPVRKEHPAPVSAHRGARDVRAPAPPEVFFRRHLLRPDARRREVHREAEGLQEGLHDVPGRRFRPGSHARGGGRPEGDQHGRWPRRPRSSAARPTSPRRSPR